MAEGERVVSVSVDSPLGSKMNLAVGGSQVLGGVRYVGVGSEVPAQVSSSEGSGGPVSYSTTAGLSQAEVTDQARLEDLQANAMQNAARTGRPSSVVFGGRTFVYSVGAGGAIESKEIVNSEVAAVAPEVKAEVKAQTPVYSFNLGGQQVMGAPGTKFTDITTGIRYRITDAGKLQAVGIADYGQPKNTTLWPVGEATGLGYYPVDRSILEVIPPFQRQHSVMPGIQSEYNRFLSKYTSKQVETDLFAESAPKEFAARLGLERLGADIDSLESYYWGRSVNEPGAFLPAAVTASVVRGLKEIPGSVASIGLKAAGYVKTDLEAAGENLNFFVKAATPIEKDLARAVSVEVAAVAPMFGFEQTNAGYQFSFKQLARTFGANVFLVKGAKVGGEVVKSVSEKAASQLRYEVKSISKVLIYPEATVLLGNRSVIPGSALVESTVDISIAGVKVGSKPSVSVFTPRTEGGGISFVGINGGTLAYAKGLEFTGRGSGLAASPAALSSIESVGVGSRFGLASVIGVNPVSGAARLLVRNSDLIARQSASTVTPLAFIEKGVWRQAPIDMVIRGTQRSDIDSSLAFAFNTRRTSFEYGAVDRYYLARLKKFRQKYSDMPIKEITHDDYRELGDLRPVIRPEPSLKGGLPSKEYLGVQNDFVLEISKGSAVQERGFVREVVGKPRVPEAKDVYISGIRPSAEDLRTVEFSLPLEDVRASSKFSKPMKPLPIQEEASKIAVEVGGKQSSIGVVVQKPLFTRVNEAVSTISKEVSRQSEARSRSIIEARLSGFSSRTAAVLRRGAAVQGVRSFETQGQTRVLQRPFRPVQEQVTRSVQKEFVISRGGVVSVQRQAPFMERRGSMGERTVERQVEKVQERQVVKERLVEKQVNRELERQVEKERLVEKQVNRELERQIQPEKTLSRTMPLTQVVRPGGPKPPIMRLPLPSSKSSEKRLERNYNKQEKKKKVGDIVLDPYSSYEAKTQSEILRQKPAKSPDVKTASNYWWASFGGYVPTSDMIKSRRRGQMTMYGLIAWLMALVAWFVTASIRNTIETDAIVIFGASSPTGILISMIEPILVLSLFASFFVYVMPVRSQGPYGY